MLMNDWLRWVFFAVTTARLRSFLTALGISIGIAAVTLLTSIGEGIRVYLMDSFSQFGTRIIAVTPGKTTTAGLAGLLTTIRPLSLDDARRVAYRAVQTSMVSVEGLVQSAQMLRGLGGVGQLRDIIEDVRSNLPASLIDPATQAS